MNTFFLDSFINTKELNHLEKDVKRKQLNKAINILSKFNDMQINIIKKQGIDIAQPFKKQKKCKKIFLNTD